MNDATTEALEQLVRRVEDAELRCRILAYALRGAVSQLNPNAEVVARRMANIAIQVLRPADQRERHLQILQEIFPDACDRSGDKDYIKPSSR